MSPHVQRVVKALREQMGAPVLVNGTIMQLVSFEAREHHLDGASLSCEFRVFEAQAKQAAPAQFTIDKEQAQRILDRGVIKLEEHGS